MKQKKSLLSNGTKIGILIAFIYSILVLIAFISKTQSLYNLMERNYLSLAF
jgi:hypothetical protein